MTIVERLKNNFISPISELFHFSTFSFLSTTLHFHAIDSRFVAAFDSFHTESDAWYIRAAGAIFDVALLALVAFVRKIDCSCGFRNLSIWLRGLARARKTVSHFKIMSYDFIKHHLLGQLYILLIIWTSRTLSSFCSPSVFWSAGSRVSILFRPFMLHFFGP